jgi:hypothetical protein
MRVATASRGFSLAASKNFLRECALSGAPDKAHYLDSCIIQSDCEMDAPGRDGSGVSGTFTPDKASQAFEEREQFRRWPPFSRRRGVESRSPPECLQHVALHLKIGRKVASHNKGGNSA